MDTTVHVLPNEQGDTDWYYRQNTFERDAINRQVKYKRAYYPGLADGRDIRLPSHTYPYILPAGCEYLSIYQPIAPELFSYLSKEDIEIHSGIRNLKSSQAACFNILFPMRKDLNFAKSALGQFLPDVQSIDDIEFEYTGPIETTQWLGEPARGKRGKNRTSIDVAVFWKDKWGKSNISLIEWKYTERNFGPCSVYSSKENKNICNQINLSSPENPSHLCPLSILRGGNPRRYWEHLKISGILIEKMKIISGCPFRTPIYQIMRQFEIAAYLRKTKLADFVEVISISFSGNTALLDVPIELEPLASSDDNNIISAWNSLLLDVPPLRHFTVEQIMQQIDLQNKHDPDWREYIKNRYGV